MPPPDPFWICHECHAEMRPVQIDGGPHCASCGSEFIEILDPEINPDPMYELPPPPPVRPPSMQSSPYPTNPRSRVSNPSAGLGGLFDLMAGGAGGGGSRQPNTTGSPRSGGSGNAAGGRTYTMQFPGGGQGSVTFGSFGGGSGGFGMFGGTGGGGSGGPHQDAGLDAFFPGFAAPRSRAPGSQAEMMAPEDLLSALMSIMGEQGGMNRAFGPQGSSNLGDYVMTQQGFDDVLERLMTAAGPQGPTPASDVVIEGLPRFTLDDKRLNESQFKDCPVCKDDFNVGEEVMQVPCRHLFHPDCIQPWLKVNGSCPVCRFSLVPDEANRSSRPDPVPGSPITDTSSAGGGSGIGGMVSGILRGLFGGGEGQDGQPAASSTNPTNPVNTQNPTTDSSQFPNDGPSLQAPILPDHIVPPPSNSTPAQQAPPVPTPATQPITSGDSSAYSTAIPDDYRERHLRRERELEARREEERRRARDDVLHDDLD